jgi:hypothetical protein
VSGETASILAGLCFLVGGAGLYAEARPYLRWMWLHLTVLAVATLAVAFGYWTLISGLYDMAYAYGLRELRLDVARGLLGLGLVAALAVAVVWLPRFLGEPRRRLRDLVMWRTSLAERLALPAAVAAPVMLALQPFYPHAR